MKTKLLNRKTAAAATALSFLTTGGVFAQASSLVEGSDQASSDLSSNLPNVFESVVNVLLFIVGAASVIMLIVGGVRYVVSSGDQNAVAGAKNTILYAIVGIVVAFLAYAAVNFVLGELGAG